MLDGQQQYNCTGIAEQDLILQALQRNKSSQQCSIIIYVGKEKDKQLNTNIIHYKQ